jgi:signal transduction histidine kinase
MPKGNRLVPLATSKLRSTVRSQARAWRCDGRDGRKQNEGERDELRRRLMRAQEDERLRLARDLHDQTGQSLTAIMLELKNIENMSDGSSRDRLRAGLSERVCNLPMASFRE